MGTVFNQPDYSAAYQLIEWRRFKEALAEAERQLRLEPEDPDGMALVAEIYFQMNEYDKALYWSREAMLREPDHQLAWYVRVRVHFETNEVKAFNESVEEALRIDPYEPHYYFLKAQLLNKKSKFREAKEELLLALELRPESPLYLASMSYTEALLGNDAESQRLDRQAIREGAEQPIVLMYLAWAAAERGDYSLREDYMRSAVRLSPDDKQYQDEYLEALQQNNPVFKVLLYPGRLLRKLRPWQVFLVWALAWLLFKPLLVLFIIIYVLVHWGSKAIVHVKVFGWRGRGS
ncbi:tetratricopeptide repeat protein [Paenibacillus jiagnxiensis]|uniref:tetratricopeptide repeat protein n=1 Tax=Paenibacillus jiagnxiensis TaxID=3228926 RepID=UPI0033AF021C